MTSPRYLGPPSEPKVIQVLEGDDDPRTTVNSALEALREHSRQVSRACRDMLQGKLNSVGTLTLTANAASTTLSDPNIRVNCGIYWNPWTANAWTEFKGASFQELQANRVNGQATIAHANNAQTDRTFRYFIVGG